MKDETSLEIDTIVIGINDANFHYSRLDVLA